jgi:hypothetical protein
MATIIDQAIEILHATRDGDDLAPRDLYLIQLAVNDQLNDIGKDAFACLVANVTKPEGYTQPWFWGIEHLTKDHAGYVYWKGQQVEHYSFYGKAAANRERIAAEELARACRDCEERGLPVKFQNLIFRKEVSPCPLSL